jgi:hypothetical protein
MLLKRFGRRQQIRARGCRNEALECRRTSTCGDGWRFSVASVFLPTGSYMDEADIPKLTETLSHLASKKRASWFNDEHRPAMGSSLGACAFAMDNLFLE